MANTSPVWVYYKNIATGDELHEPTRLDGEAGAPYEIAILDIANYQYIDTSGSLTGLFGSLPQSLELYYRPQEWQAVHRINMFIETVTSVQVFLEPDNLSNVTTNLNPNTFWATQLRAISGNGQFWYQIGDYHWIRYDATQMELSDTAPEVENINYFNDAEKSKSNQPNAVVNFLPDRSIEVYAEPYGLPIGSVSDSDFVAITEEIHDDNNIVWYKIATKGWINSIYINKL